MVRLIDPYALAISALVGCVGFGMTFYFNTTISSWGMEEIVYPAAAMVYIYLRNGRFNTASNKKLKGNASNNKGRNGWGTPGCGADGVPDERLATGDNRIQVPLPAEVIPGVIPVKGAPLGPLKDGALAVVFFWATWCGFSQKFLPALLALAGSYSDIGVTFVGVTQESEEDLRYFVETYSRPSRSVNFVADQEGLLTQGYQGAHGVKAIPHCYIIRGVKSTDSSPEIIGIVEWHGHPSRLETALAYVLEEGEEEKEEDAAVGEDR